MKEAYNKELYEIDVAFTTNDGMYRDRKHLHGNVRLTKKNIVSTIRNLLESKYNTKCEIIFLFFSLDDNIIFSMSNEDIINSYNEVDRKGMKMMLLM